MDHVPTLYRTAHYVQVFALSVGVILTTGCSLFGPIEPRAEAINVITGEYASASTLYNIVRAANAEPLNFVSLTGVTGHQTAMFGLGLPTISVGPDKSSAAKEFLFGPNSIGGSEANDFNVNVVDDPTSYQALLRPTDPATLGFLLAQSYDPTLIFFLFISNIEAVRDGKVVEIYTSDPYGSSDRGAQVTCAKLNRPDQYSLIESEEPESLGFDECFFSFYNKLDDLIKRGLYVVVDPFYVPASDTYGAAEFCLSKVLSGQNTSPGADATIRAGPVCPAEEKTKTSAQSGGSHEGRVAAGASKNPADAQKPSRTEEKWSLPDPSTGSMLYFRTRSVYGVYRFLGQLIRLQQLADRDPGARKRLEEGDTEKNFFSGYPAGRVLYLSHDSSNCWTSVRYEGIRWCVPRSADGTKRVFQDLHQLFELYTTKNNQPVTSTVRTTP